ncbi:MAG: hypothetical protein IJR91_07790 [Ruminococcus sp.]|nr:hypothetical protein [Ruminococcus sp.]
MKRIWFFIITGLLAFCAAGSRGTVSSLDRAMVSAVGIDTSDKGYKVTLQIFRPDSAGTDTQLDPAKANIFVVSEAAATVEEAMNRCEDRLGEFLFIGHNQLTVIGEGVELSRPEQLLASLYKSKESYLGARVAYSESAEKLLSAELSEGIVAAQSVVSIIERHCENSSSVSCDLLRAMDAGRDTVVMPLLRTVSSKGEETVSAEGAAMFTDGIHRCDLDAQECSAAALLTNECSRAVLDYETEDGLSSVTVKGLRCRRAIAEEGGRLSCRFTVEGEIQEDQSTPPAGERESLVGQCEDELEQRCSRLIGLIYEQEADPIELTELISSRFPGVWYGCGEDFAEALKLTDISVKAKISVREG